MALAIAHGGDSGLHVEFDGEATARVVAKITDDVGLRRTARHSWSDWSVTDHGGSARAELVQLAWMTTAPTSRLLEESSR